MKISIIAAMDEKRGIGKNNSLLFRIPQDFERMGRLTSEHAIIMGRKTFESIGRPLLNRLNIVVTHNTDRRQKGLIFAFSLEEAIQTAKQYELDKTKEDKKHIPEIFIFGGAQIYREALDKNLVDKLYLTIIDASFDADTFFPDYSEFKKVVSEEKRESDGYKYRFLELERV